MKHLWDIAMYVDRQLAAWKKTLWNDINTNEMDEQIKRIPKELRLLGKEIRCVVCVLVSFVNARSHPAVFPLLFLFVILAGAPTHSLSCRALFATSRIRCRLWPTWRTRRCDRVTGSC